MSSLSRLSGALIVAMALFVIAFAGARAFGATPPPLPLTTALLLGSIAFLAMGVGVWRRSRTAWSFAVAMSGVGAVAMLLAVPALLRGGIHWGGAVGAVALMGVVNALLIVGRKEIP